MVEGLPPAVSVEKRRMWHIEARKRSFFSAALGPGASMFGSSIPVVNAGARQRSVSSPFPTVGGAAQTRGRNTVSTAGAPLHRASGPSRLEPLWAAMATTLSMPPRVALLGRGCLHGAVLPLPPKRTAPPPPPLKPHSWGSLKNVEGPVWT